MSTTVSTTAAPATTGKRVEILGLLRGIAALSVCLYHYSGYLPKLHVPEIETVFKYGWVGVDIFFVISGFIIPYSLFGKEYTGKSFFIFMLKRVIRINPPAYIVMVATLAQYYLIDHYIGHKIEYTKDISFWQLVNNFTFTIPFTHYKWIVGIFWTLAIEFQFYIFIGLTFKLLFDKPNVYVYSLVYLALGALQFIPGMPKESLFHFSALFAMGGISLLYFKRAIDLKTYGLMLLLFTAVGVYEMGVLITIMGLLTALVINFVSYSNRGFNLLGEISYSFYLLHALVGNTCEFVLFKILHPQSDILKGLLMLVCVLASLVVAYIYYQLVEKQFMQMSNRLFKKPVGSKG